MNMFGHFTNSTKPVVLRSIYRELTGDASGSSTLNEAAIDKRLKEALSFEDVDIIVDLRESNEGRRGKYDTFWTKADLCIRSTFLDIVYLSWIWIFSLPVE